MRLRPKFWHRWPMKRHGSDDSPPSGTSFGVWLRKRWLKTRGARRCEWKPCSDAIQDDTKVLEAVCALPPDVQADARRAWKACHARRASLDPQARLRPPCRIMQIWVVAHGVGYNSRRRIIPGRFRTAPLRSRLSNGCVAPQGLLCYLARCGLSSQMWRLLRPGWCNSPLWRGTTRQEPAGVVLIMLRFKTSEVSKT